MKIDQKTNRWGVFKWLVAIFLPLFISAGGIVALLYYMEARSVRFTFETDESRYVARQKELIGNELKSIVSDLMVFAADNRAQQALERDDTGDWKTVAEEFISLLRSRDRYDQIRLINKAGLEVVRVAVRDGEPNIISEDLLQSISEGDDLNEVLKLERDEIYLSSFDLHIKMGAERQTSGIVIRVGMPFFDNGGRYLGAIIFDYPGAHLASLMEKIRSHDLVADLLLSGDGSDLGRTIKGESGDWNPAVPFQEAWQGISEADSGQFYTGDGLFTFATLYPFSEVQGSIREFGKTPRFGTNQKNQNPEGWKVVSFVPKGVLNAPSGKFLRKSFIFYILFSGLLAVGSLVLARIAVNRKVAETALRESDIQIRNIVNTTLDGIVITNDKGVVALFNPAAEQIFGYKSSEVIGESVNRLIPGPYRKEQNNYPSHYLDNDGRRNAGARREVIGQRKDGTRFPIELAVSEVRLKDRRLFTGIVRDITSRREMEEQLRHKAYHDTLTSLPNRSLMVSRLKRSIKLAKTRKDYLFAVLFLDLDRFKVINDSLGHAIGDQLLIAISRRLEKCLRPGDTVARIGGDELAILLEDVGEVGFVKRVSDRIHKEVALPFNINGHEIFNTVSIGIALSSTGYEKPEDILRDADIAMYRAKILGKSRHEIFDKVMHNRAVALQQLETDLRRAVGQKEFQLYYQPIVSLNTARIIGFEALVRWNHPERGLIFPDRFIPLAEETRLIVPIGYFVLFEACRQMQEWQKLFPGNRPLEISVNLSSKQFLQPNLVNEIKQILGETGLGAHSLRLEITESLILEDVEAINANLTQLRRLDIQLDIDDFGTGYSSLSYLHQFPFNALKIDRSFTSRIDEQGENLELVKMIVSLAHNFGMEVIVEGVERAEQMEQLKLLKCEYGQGYFFSKPVDRDAAAALIAANVQVLHT